MKPTDKRLELELGWEFTDFLWNHVEWWSEEGFRDGCAIPDCVIEDMNRSLRNWK